MAAALKPLSSQPKCRICRSPRRADIEALLSRLGEEDAAFGVLTLDKIALQAIPALDGGGPSSASALKRHRAKHAEKIEAGGESAPEPAWEDDEIMQALVAEMGELASRARVSPSDLLNLQQRMWLHQTQAKLRRGETVPITGDAAARAAALLQKSERDAAEGELLGLMGQALSTVFSRPGAIGSAAPAGELVEGEAVKEPELGEGADREAGVPDRSN